MGTLDSSPCGQEARKISLSLALVKVYSCGGRLSERSYQRLAKCILFERCQNQPDESRQWLDTQILLQPNSQTLYYDYRRMGHCKIQ